MRGRIRFGIPAGILLLSCTAIFDCRAQAGNTAGPAPSAQSRPASASPSAAQPEELPSPVPITNIASEVEAANLRLRRIRIDLDAAVRLADVEQPLSVLTASLKRIQPELEGGTPLQMEELFNLRQELLQINQRLKRLQEMLVPRSQMLEERREELARMEALWRVTYQSLAAQDAPASTRDLIRSIQQKIEETVKELRTCRPVLLTVQNRISEQLIAADIMLPRIHEALDEIRKRLLTIDSEPLWRAILSGKTNISMDEAIRRFTLHRLMPLLDYLTEHRWRLWLHLLISFFLIWLSLTVSRRSRRWSDPGGEDQKSPEALRHPVAAALVVSLMLSFLIYPNAPLVLYRMPMLLLVFPLSRVVSGALSREERSSFYFLAALYVLRRLDLLIASSELPYRIFLLALSGFGLFGALWGVRVDLRASHSGIGPWRKARLQLLRLGAAVLVGSLLSNLAGNVTLAELLANACIGSAFAGAALFAAVMSLEGFLYPLFHSPAARWSLAIREQSSTFQRRVPSLIHMGALIIWVWVTLLMLGLSKPFLDTILAVLARQWSFGQLSFSLGGILLFLVIISVSVWMAHWVAFISEKDILSRLKLPQGIPATVSMLIRNGIVVLGILLALASAGVQWSQVVLIASAVGVGIGLGLQHLVASFIAGLILIFERPIRVGDTVEVGKVFGMVTRIGLRSSIIRVPDGSEVICPNNRLISEDLLNWTLSDRLRRVEIQVGVALGSDPHAVLTILKKAACETAGVLPKPEPEAILKSYGESSMIFLLRCFTTCDRWVETGSAASVRIDKELQDAGIQIALPVRDIRMQTENRRILQ